MRLDEVVRLREDSSKVQQILGKMDRAWFAMDDARKKLKNAFTAGGALQMDRAELEELEQALAQYEQEFKLLQQELQSEYEANPPPDDINF